MPSVSVKTLTVASLPTEKTTTSSNIDAPFPSVHPPDSVNVTVPSSGWLKVSPGLALSGQVVQRPSGSIR